MRGRKLLAKEQRKMFLVRGATIPFLTMLCSAVKLEVVHMCNFLHSLAPLIRWCSASLHLAGSLLQ
jgi:hypothetical protein